MLKHDKLILILIWTQKLKEIYSYAYRHEHANCSFLYEIFVFSPLNGFPFGT